MSRSLRGRLDRLEKAVPESRDGVGLFFAALLRAAVDPDNISPADLAVLRPLLEVRLTVPMPGAPDPEGAANFANATMRGANLSGAVLRGANFHKATLDGTDFEGANLQDAKFVQAFLPGARFRKATLSGCEFTGGATLTKADLSGATAIGSSFNRAEMAGADLSRCVFSPEGRQTAETPSVSFVSANLTGATLAGAQLYRATFDGAKLLGATFDGADMAWARLTGRADMSGATFRKAVLVWAHFQEGFMSRADLTGAVCRGAHFIQVQMPEAVLSKADFTEAEFTDADLSKADVRGAVFREAQLQGSKWSHVRNLAEARDLATTIVPEAKEAKYVDTCEVGWVDSVAGWERLRAFGRLPLFGASYVVLLTIPAYLYFLAWFNAQVAAVREALANLEDRYDNVVINRLAAHGPELNPLPMPSWPLLTLCSTVLLAVASTIYAVFCPPRIKEFSRDMWCDQLRKPLIHYWPYSWRFPALRVACGVCYLVGGAGALVVIARKLITATVFIVNHS